jgi:OFA family oxalate/formate antiporter-like MFS transporter
VLVKWFPDRRGLATGLAAAGFAAGAVIGAPVAGALVVSVGVLPTFALIGAASLVVVGGAALLMQPPPPGYQPIGWQPPAMARDAADDYTLGEALRTPQWYAFWAQIFLKGSVGLALVSQAAPMAEEITGISAALAAALVGAVSLGNMAGRFCWACLSDAIGRRVVFAAIFLVEATAFFLLPYATDAVTFGALAFLVVFSFGGGLGAMPAMAADYFGPTHVGSIFGLILTASGVGSALGPLAMAWSLQATGGYGSALWLLIHRPVRARSAPVVATALSRAQGIGWRSQRRHRRGVASYAALPRPSSAPMISGEAAPTQGCEGMLLAASRTLPPSSSTTAKGQIAFPTERTQLSPGTPRPGTTVRHDRTRYVHSVTPCDHILAAVYHFRPSRPRGTTLRARASLISGR